MAVSSCAKGQTAVLCELCDADNGVQWRCVTCGENMCNSCKLVHCRAKISKNHKVKKYEEFSSERYQGKYVDEILLLCSFHSEEPFQMICANCDALVCFTCINGPHKNHTFSNIPEEVMHQRQELLLCVSKAEKQLDESIKNRKALQSNIVQYETDTHQTIEKIQERKAELKSAVDTAADDLICVIQSREVRDKQMLENMGKLMDRTIDSLGNKISSFKEKILSGKADYLDQFLKESNLRYQSHSKCLATPSGLQTPVYVAQDINRRIVKDMLGEVLFRADSKLTSVGGGIKLVSKHKLARRENFICTAGTEQAWLHLHGQPDLTLITNNGTMRTVKTNFRIFGFDVTLSGNLIVSVYAGNHVKKLKDDETFVDIYDASPFMTCGVRSTDNSVLVTLYNDSQSKIARLSINGDVLQMIEPCGQQKATSLLKATVALEELENGIICVKDYDHKSNITSIIWIDQSGKEQLRYGGHLDQCMDKAFYPGKVIKGPTGTVLISDTENNSIQVLDEEGNFLYYLMTEQDGLDNPKGMSLDASGQLWICNTGKNEIIIAKIID